MRKRSAQAVAFATVLACAAGLGAQGFVLPDMQVRSQAFADGGIIPIRYTSHGANIQPGFTITGAPAGTKTYAIIMRDIDVAMDRGTEGVIHWIAYDIPSPEIPEGGLPRGSVTGANFSGRATFMGSGAPLRNRYHHYLWEFYALDARLDLPEGATMAEVTKAMQGKVVGKAAYVGRYADARPR